MKLKAIGDFFYSLSDGVLFQAGMVGALSFNHIHDLVSRYGQGGWESWLYPPSVDLLIVAAFRKARTKGGFLPWFTFGIGILASLAANVLDARITGHGVAVALVIGAWPPVALTFCTALSHGDKRATPLAEVPAVVPVAPAVEQEVPEQEATPEPEAEEVPEGIEPNLRPAKGSSSEAYITYVFNTMDSQELEKRGWRTRLAEQVTKLMAEDGAKAPAYSTIMRDLTKVVPSAA